VAVAEKDLLAAVFGSGTDGMAPRERALSSDRVFIRSYDQLAVAAAGSTGRQMTAIEALDAYGFEKLLEAVEYGTAVLPPSRDEPSTTLRGARATLGLTQQAVADHARVGLELIRDAENPRRRVPIRELQKIAMVLGLDERLIGFSPTASLDTELGTRLKQLGREETTFSPLLVATFAEAAWVIRTENRLRGLLNWTASALAAFERDSFYGSAAFRAWNHGYLLAERTRSILGVPRSLPLRPLRAWTSRLGIPLVQAELPMRVAGATLASGGVRGIIVNTRGRNSNVWVRRSTIAHELGHLLWDPDHELTPVRVDDYSVIGHYSATGSYVEARANAFAVELLAPRAEVDLRYRTSESNETGVRDVMEHFGISYTAARYHIKNASGGEIPLSALTTSDHNDTAEWRATESFTDDWFPFATTSSMRRGTFAACVVAAEKGGLIHEDTAASYLQCTRAEYRASVQSIAEVFADLIANPTL
jgi:transcriptional regulator with XRE-family HTH domain